MRLLVSSLSASTTFLRATMRKRHPVMSSGLPLLSSIQRPSAKDLRACRRRTVSLSGLLPTYAMCVSFHKRKRGRQEGLPPPLPVHLLSERLLAGRGCRRLAALGGCAAALGASELVEDVEHAPREGVELLGDLAKCFERIHVNLLLIEAER